MLHWMSAHGDWTERDEVAIPKDCARDAITELCTDGLQQYSEVDIDICIVCVTTFPNKGATPPGHVAPAGHSRQVPLFLDVLIMFK